MDGKTELDPKTYEPLGVGTVNENDFVCTVCGYVAKSNAGLQAHIRFNHKEK
jgi:hypothetical protein